MKQTENSDIMLLKAVITTRAVTKRMSHATDHELGSFCVRDQARVPCGTERECEIMNLFISKVLNRIPL